jgi:methyl-accepting chemotaxis protein
MLASIRYKGGSHNKKYSQPLTGNKDIDLINNRTKRIFKDKVGSTCGKHTYPYLLQTYRRDTGELMHDISAPLYIKGKHWGGLRIGYKA